MIPVANRSRGQRCDVTAATGLRNRKRRDLVSCQNRRQKSPLLFLGPEVQDRRQRNGMTAKTSRRAERRARDDRLFRRSNHVRQVAATAAVRLGIADAKNAGFPSFLVEFARKFVRFFPRMGKWLDVLFRQPANLFAKLSVISGFVERGRKGHDKFVLGCKVNRHPRAYERSCARRGVRFRCFRLRTGVSLAASTTTARRRSTTRRRRSSVWCGSRGDNRCRRRLRPDGDLVWTSKVGACRCGQRCDNKDNRR